MLGLTRHDLTALLPGMAILAVCTWFTAEAGGYAAEVWLPAGLLLVAVGAVSAMALGATLPRLGRPLAIAVGAFAAYTAWSYLSIAWAQDPGAALTGSHRTLLYLVAFTFAAMLPWTSAAARLFFAGLAIAMTVIAAVTMLDTAGSRDVASSFLEGRFDAPIGYPNAAAALWTMGAVPALLVAARRETPTLLRPILLACATALLGVSILGQSRGWLLALPVLAAVAIVLGPSRVRLLVFTAPVAMSLLAALPALLEPYQAYLGDRSVADAYDGAARAVLVSALAAGIAGAVLAALDRRTEIHPRTSRRAGRVATGLGVAALIAVVGLVLVRVDGRPIDRAEVAWSEFTGETAGRYDTSTRFTSVTTPRYRMWQVAVEAWGEAPVVGLGQDNFAERYLLTRRTPEEPRWPHSIELRLLVHTGLVGALLFAVFVAAGLVAAFRGARAHPARLVVAVAAVSPLVLWLVHGSVDWLWEYPALSVVALAAFGIAARLSTGEPGLGSGRRVPRALAAAGGATTLVAAAALAVAFLAERDYRSIAHWREQPAETLERLDRAARLAPLDHRPALAEGLIAWSTRDRRRARRAMLQAARRKPHDWFVQLQLGVLSGEVRDLRRARGHLRLALQRNPHDPVVKEVLDRTLAGRPLSRMEVDRALAVRQARFDRTG